MVEIDEHDDAGFGRDAGERDKTDHHGDAEVVIEQPHEPQPADQRERQAEHDDQRLGDAPEVEVQQQEDDEQRQRHDDLHPRFRPLQVLELAAPSDPVAGREAHLFGHGAARVGDVAADVAIPEIDEDVDGELGVLGAECSPGPASDGRWPPGRAARRRRRASRSAPRLAIACGSERRRAGSGR